VKSMTCTLPDPLYEALQERLQTENASRDHVVSEIRRGSPWGTASCLVRPHEKTLSISGDVGFLFSRMELETAVRPKLNLVHMV
jgi:hypothetical protein